MNQYFSKQYGRSDGNVRVQSDLSNYATKADLKGALGIDTSTLASKTNLASLKIKVHDLNVNKLKTVPAK